MHLSSRNNRVSITELDEPHCGVVQKEAASQRIGGAVVESGWAFANEDRKSRSRSNFATVGGGECQRAFHRDDVGNRNTEVGKGNRDELALSRIVFDLDAIGTKSDGLIDWATTIIELKNKSRSGRNSRKIGSEIAFDHTRDSGGSHDQCSTPVLEVRALAIDLDCGADISCSNTSDSICLLEEEVSNQSSWNSSDIEISKFGGGGKKSNAEERAGRKCVPYNIGFGSAGINLNLGAADGEEKTGKIKEQFVNRETTCESGLGKLKVTISISNGCEGLP